jgi:hypothetical protein
MATRTATANGDSINVLIQAADDIIDAAGYTLIQTAAAVCHSLIDSTLSGASEIALTDNLTTTNGIANVKIACSAHKLAAADTPATATTLAFTVASDVASSYPAGMQFTAAGTVGNTNNGDYVVDSPGAVFAAGVTTIPCTVAKRPSAQATETGTLQRWTPISIVGDIVNTECDGMVVAAGAMLEILDDVTGFMSGIDISGGTITTISGTVATPAATTINMTGGTITTLSGDASGYDGIIMAGGTITTLSGTVTGGGDYGILMSGGTITTMSGEVSGSDGINISGGTITTLSGTVSGGTGINISGGTITTMSGTAISNMDYGIYMLDGTITTLSGTASGAYYGISMRGGTITTMSGTASFAGMDSDGAAVRMVGGTITTLSGNLVNEGSVGSLLYFEDGTITTWCRTLAQLAAGLDSETFYGDVINIGSIVVSDLPTVAFAGGAAAEVVAGRAYKIPAAASVVLPAVTSTAAADGVEGLDVGAVAKRILDAAEVEAVKAFILRPADGGPANLLDSVNGTFNDTTDDAAVATAERRRVLALRGREI